MPSPTSRAGLSNGPSNSGSVTTHLFIGSDPVAKDARLKQLKREYIAPGAADFNTDNLYAKDITLKDLQERLQSLPVNSPNRIVIIRDARNLKSDCKEYLAVYAKTPYKGVVLVIDIEPQDKRDAFVAQMQRVSNVERFKEEARPDTFILCRQIEARKADAAVRILHQLLDGGEKAERIMGGMRYSWAHSGLGAAQAGRRLRLLLACDREIKTGMLKPVFALEKLIVVLCGT